MRKKWEWSLLTIGCIVVLTVGSMDAAHAQSYPNKPIRLVVPFIAGGAADLLAREVGQKLAEGWGQPVVIENKPGAGGVIGAEMVAKAAPDGYTLVLGTVVTHAIDVSMVSKLPYDPIRDFSPITLVGSIANVLVVNPSVPANSVKELIGLAKSKPGQLNFASSGSGLSQHLAGELFKTMAGVDIVHIPYKGSIPAITAVVNGESSLIFNVLPTTIPQIKAGKVRALAVTSAKRSVILPDLQTVSEAGLPGFDVVSWFGILAPAGTPKEIVAKLNKEIVKILQMPDVRDRLFKQGAEPLSCTPEQFDAHIKREIVKWGEVVKKSGAKME